MQPDVVHMMWKRLSKGMDGKVLSIHLDLILAIGLTKIESVLVCFTIFVGTSAKMLNQIGGAVAASGVPCDLGDSTHNPWFNLYLTGARLFAW